MKPARPFCLSSRMPKWLLPLPTEPTSANLDVSFFQDPEQSLHRAIRSNVHISEGKRYRKTDLRQHKKLNWHRCISQAATFCRQEHVLGL